MKRKYSYFLLVILIGLQLNGQEKIEAPFDLTIEKVTFPEKNFTIEDFGAKEGGKVKCTKAFADAIETATKAGGGYVIVPNGKWLTGSIVLKTMFALS